MNLLSSITSTTISEARPGALPFGMEGAALARLSSPAQNLEWMQAQTVGMMQLTSQLFEMLITLMAGSPAQTGISQTGTVTPGERIPGGRSLYGKGKMFHKGAPGAPDTYAFENSPAGIKFAADHGYKSIDIDLQITKDGVPVATHWNKPMAKDGFYDPEGKLGKKTKVSQMTLAEVMRLRNKDGQSRIYPVSQLMGEFKKHGIAPDFEAKDDPRFKTDKVMSYLANLVRNTGVKANMKSIDRGPRSLDILKTAQKHGFWTRFATGGGKKGRPLGYE